MSSFWLEFDHNGQTQNASFNSQSVTIGRDRGSDFILDHPTVSRQHALIVEEGGGNYRLVVLSRGGLTAVDGQPVSGEVSLWDGAMLTLGKHSVRFRAPDATARAPQAPAAAQQAPGPQSGGFGAT
ncbi:FHA domain-containing protein, partial [Lujinxingia vulgaris]